MGGRSRDLLLAIVLSALGGFLWLGWWREAAVRAVGAAAIALVVASLVLTKGPVLQRLQAVLLATMVVALARDGGVGRGAASLVVTVSLALVSCWLFVRPDKPVAEFELM